jgi:hypothetical protein
MMIKHLSKLTCIQRAAVDIIGTLQQINMTKKHDDPEIIKEMDDIQDAINEIENHMENIEEDSFPVLPVGITFVTLKSINLSNPHAK